MSQLKMTNVPRSTSRRRVSFGMVRMISATAKDRNSPARCRPRRRAGPAEPQRGEAKRFGRCRIRRFRPEGTRDRVIKLWEIAENLHRAELTQLQRKEQIAEWIRLTDLSAGLRQKGVGHRGEGGLSAAAREIGVKRTSAKSHCSSARSAASMPLATVERRWSLHGSGRRRRSQRTR